MRIVPASYDDPEAVRLRDALIADLSRRYDDGEGDATPIAPGAFDPPNGAFLIAWIDGVAAGCVGWRHRPDLTETAGGLPIAELKRMWVGLDFRGRGLARAMLAAVEDSARTAGHHRLVLETGTGQPEAIALYTSSGYERIFPGIGHYKDHDDARSYARGLV